jgi:hypothetical protein
MAKEKQAETPPTPDVAPGIITTETPTHSNPPEPAVRISDSLEEIRDIKRRLAESELKIKTLRAVLLGFTSNPAAISADPALCKAVQEALE